jgi:hypothetical protein
MGLKDWKKTNLGWEKRSNSSHYGNKDIIFGKYTSKSIYWKSSGVQNAKGKYVWGVLITEDSQTISSKYFLNKSSALKFARAYMRSH